VTQNHSVTCTDLLRTCNSVCWHLGSQRMKFIFMFFHLQHVHTTSQQTVASCWDARFYFNQFLLEQGYTNRRQVENDFFRDTSFCTDLSNQSYKCNLMLPVSTRKERLLTKINIKMENIFKTKTFITQNKIHGVKRKWKWHINWFIITLAHSRCASFCILLQKFKCCNYGNKMLMSCKLK